MPISFRTHPLQGSSWLSSFFDPLASFFELFFVSQALLVRKLHFHNQFILHFYFQIRPTLHHQVDGAHRVVVQGFFKALIWPNLSYDPADLCFFNRDGANFLLFVKFLPFQILKFQDYTGYLRLVRLHTGEFNSMAPP